METLESESQKSKKAIQEQQIEKENIRKNLEQELESTKNNLLNLQESSRKEIEAMKLESERKETEKQALLVKIEKLVQNLDLMNLS